MTNYGKDVRRVLSFICFEPSSFPSLSNSGLKPWGFEKVRCAFESWVNARNMDIFEISKDIRDLDPQSKDFVWYKVDKNKLAGIIILYIVSGFYEFRFDNRDKHADLILDILKHISDGSFPSQTIIWEINLGYYWSKERMAYMKKVYELEKMTDETFKSLPDLETWLNT